MGVGGAECGSSRAALIARRRWHGPSALLVLALLPLPHCIDNVNLCDAITLNVGNRAAKRLPHRRQVAVGLDLFVVMGCSGV